MAQRFLLRFSALNQVVLDRLSLVMSLIVNLLAANKIYKSLILEKPG